jgi:hypothetical protein
MAIKQRRLNMAMSDFRNEFLGTSGEVKMSDLVRESVSSAGGGGTRNAGNTNSSFAGRLSNNKLSASAVGVYIGNSSVPAAGTAPTYAATNPKTSTSNMAFSDYNGVSGSFPSSKWSLTAASGEMFGNSGSQTGAYISRNIDYSPTVKNSGYDFNNGFAQQAGYKAMNETSYLHEDLCSVARPGDVMFAIFCSNSGANFTSAAFYPSNGTTGTFSSAAQCSNNWQGQSNNAYEFSDGNDRVTYAVAKRCTGGETHASFYMYSSAANSTVYFGYYVGIIRCRGVGSGLNTSISHLAIGTNADFYIQMGSSYGYGEACIIGDLSGYSTNNPAVSTSSSSNHMMRSELSVCSTQYGPLSAAAGMYEEGVDVAKGNPTTTRYLYCRTGTTDNLQFVLRVNTWN